MKRVIKGVKYDTESAVLLADDRYWDDSDNRRDGRNTYLYRGKGGRYFAHLATIWEGEQDLLLPLTLEEAISIFDGSPNHKMEYEDAFPGSPVEDA